MRRLIVAIAAVGLAAMGMATMPAALAAGTTCNSNTPVTGTTGSLIVPPGGTCELSGATVNGSVTVQTGGTLEVNNSTKITGSVTANTPREIHIYALVSAMNSIGGAVTINGTSGNGVDSEICSVNIGGSVNVSGIKVSDEVSIDGDPSENDCYGTKGTPPSTNGEVNIGGSVTLQSNAGEVELGDTDVTGSVNVISNSNGDTNGSAEIEKNDIGGTLACSGNVNGVTNGGEMNTAKTKTGQCIGK